jgi:hypothetical protein
MFALVLAGIGAGLAAGCAPSRDASPAASTPTAFVARVGDAILTDVEFASRLELRLAAGSGDKASMAQKEPVLEEWIREESIYEQARAARFDQRPDVAEALRRLVVSKFREEKLAAWNAAETVSVSDADVEARYRADPTEFFAPAAVRGAVIFLGVGQRATPEKRQARRAEAEVLREEAARSDFRLLAARHSEDQTSRYRGGDTGWLTRSDRASEPGVVQALCDLPGPGDVGPVVETSLGFYVVKLLEKRGAGPRPLAEVRELIRHRLIQAIGQKAQQEFAAAMRTGLDIEINRRLLEQIQPRAREEAPPSTPGWQTAKAGFPRTP